MKAYSSKIYNDIMIKDTEQFPNSKILRPISGASDLESDINLQMFSTETQQFEIRHALWAMVDGVSRKHQKYALYWTNPVQFTFQMNAYIYIYINIYT